MVHKLLGLLASLCAASTQALVVPRLKLARPRPRTIPTNRRGGVATASVFGEKFETWGLSLKTRGRRQRDLAKDAITPKKVARWGYAVLLYAAFIFYRARVSPRREDPTRLRRPFEREPAEAWMRRRRGDPRRRAAATSSRRPVTTRRRRDP